MLLPCKLYTLGVHFSICIPIFYALFTRIRSTYFPHIVAAIYVCGRHTRIHINVDVLFLILSDTLNATNMLH